MDPHANVVEATSIAHALLARLDSHDNLGDTENDAVRLAELVIALHEWRTAGGFDPYADAQANLQANIARVLRETGSHTPANDTYRVHLAYAMATALAGTLPGFDRDAFLQTCGVES
jgi:hypothetical protein